MKRAWTRIYTEGTKSEGHNFVVLPKQWIYRVGGWEWGVNENQDCMSVQQDGWRCSQRIRGLGQKDDEFRSQLSWVWDRMKPSSGVIKESIFDNHSLFVTNIDGDTIFSVVILSGPNKFTEFLQNQEETGPSCQITATSNSLFGCKWGTLEALWMQV